MHLFKHGGWRRGSVVARASPAFGGDAELLFLMTTRVGGGGGTLLVAKAEVKGKLLQIVRR